MKRLLLPSAILVLLIAFTFLLLPSSNGHATTIIKSKSNIANNRSANHEIGEGDSGPGDVVVLCQSCDLAIAARRDKSHLILMDNQTGDVYAYDDEALLGKADPVYVATLERVGKRLIVKKPGTP